MAWKDYTCTDIIIDFKTNDILMNWQTLFAKKLFSKGASLITYANIQTWLHLMIFVCESQNVIDICMMMSQIIRVSS